jgi:hypothetical protein
MTRKYGGNGLKANAEKVGIKLDIPPVDPEWLKELQMGLVQIRGKRISEYDEHYPEIAYQLSAKGVSRRVIGAVFGVCSDTVRSWERQYPRFAKALLQGKKDACEEVESALFRRAVGYDLENTVIQTTRTSNRKSGKPSEVMTTTKSVTHVPPSPPALIFFLCNRAPDRWRTVRKREMEQGSLPEVPAKEIEELSDERLRLLVDSLEEMVNERE